MMYGPGDYGDDFVTIEKAEARMVLGYSTPSEDRDTRKRISVREAILDLHQELEEEGYELVRRIDLHRPEIADADGVV